jgi:hypothetical protein
VGVNGGNAFSTAYYRIEIRQIALFAIFGREIPS